MFIISVVLTILILKVAVSDFQSPHLPVASSSCSSYSSITMIYKPILSDERLPILVLIVSGLLTVSDCQEDILQDIVTNVSMRASGLAGKMTDCSEHISLSNYNSTCESEVPYDKGTNLSVMVHLDWDTKAELHKRCYCSTGLLSLLIPTSVLTANLCDNDENSTIHCSKPCINESQNELVCDKKCGDLACFMYGKMPYILSNQRQLYLLVTGINCVTIKEHAQDLCNVLFTTTGPTHNTGNNLGAGAIFSIVFVGLFLSCLCTIAAVCCYCTLRLKRKQKLKFQELQMKKSIPYINFDLHKVDIYDSSTRGESVDGKPAIDFLISSTNQFANCIIPYSAIKITCELGEGAFGIVYKGKVSQGSLSEIEDVAIKTLKENSSVEQIKEFISESETMLHLDHPNVLKLLGVCFDTEDQLPAIVLPFMANGDLKSFLVEKRGHNEPSLLPESLSMEDLLSMCLDIARGMNYLSEQKFVHRDLAARNCMIDENMSVKVADFGFSRDIYNQDYYRLQRRTMLPVKWLPPESLHDNIYNEETDVWSYGVVLWEIFSLGRGPYPGLDNADIPDYVSAGNRLKQPSLCPPVIYTLMTQCWSHVPAERPKFSEIVKTFTKMDHEILPAVATSNINDRPYFVLESV